MGEHFPRKIIWKTIKFSMLAISGIQKTSVRFDFDGATCKHFWRRIRLECQISPASVQETSPEFWFWWDSPAWEFWINESKNNWEPRGLLGPPLPSAASNYYQVPRKAAAAPKSGPRGRNSPWRFASRNAASVPPNLVYLYLTPYLVCIPLYLPPLGRLPTLYTYIPTYLPTFFV